MNKNEIFTLWIPDNDRKELPQLAYLSLKSMILCGHDVTLYVYSNLDNVPKGVQVLNANEIIDSSRIFRYKTGHKTYSGFANLFRLKRLYEHGGTWLDLDVILIRNINEKFNDDIIICSEPDKHTYQHPNNSFLRFPSHDPFVKSMLDFALEKGSDVVHGETGPRLVSKMLKTSFKEYNQYLKHFNFNNIFKWQDIDNYFKNKDVLKEINTDEIVGFHLFNTFFKKIINSNETEGLFNVLKKGILESENPNEYNFYLKNNNILKNKKTNTLPKYKYTILIDSKNLKKVEIYNILHSIDKNSQVLIFGRNTLPNDKIDFNRNIHLFSSSFENIYGTILEFIQGDYIIPIDKPIIFDMNFFKNKQITSDIEHYQLNKVNSFLNIFSKKSFKIFSKILSGEIYNLSPEEICELEFLIKKFDNASIFDYGVKRKEITELIQKIDNLNNNKDIFNTIKSELLNYKFKNLIDEISYYYFTAYHNIINSDSYEEYENRETKSNLNFFNYIH